MVDLSGYFNYVVPMTGEQMTKYQTNLTAVSLFAGVGGFDLAMERNGINVVASVEIDKHASSVLAKQFPKSQLFNDIKEVSGNDLISAGFIPERGIITGGFPCQDLSVAGKRAGLAGARSGLFYEIARIADETQAKWLILENVPGLLSSQRGADMGAVVGTLVELGYGVAWRVLDAQHFGVPQRRRRVFIVAERSGDPARAAKVLFERQSVRGDTSTSGTQGQDSAGSVGQGVAEPTGFNYKAGIDIQNRVGSTPALKVGDGGGGICDGFVICCLRGEGGCAERYLQRNGTHGNQCSPSPPAITTEPPRPDLCGRASERVEDYELPTSRAVPSPDLDQPGCELGSSHTVYGQTGFARYTEGATTLTATTYKRAEDNVVVHQNQTGTEQCR